MRIPLAFVIVAGCACPNPPVAPKTAGSAETIDKTGNACEATRAHVAELYRAEAAAKEPGRVDEAAADNVAMALADCAKDPARASCLAAATSVADLEKGCLAPLDNEGTEGTSL
jgi:hypothetical protein